jgi:heme/copper-type cytochrome/quinol oxidase subunit 1
MPSLSVWAIRAALLYLVLGFTIGALMLWHKGAPLHPMLWRLLPAHIECLLFGWTVQLALGVAYWILPRFQTARGNPMLVWLALGLLNLGVVLVSVAPFMAAPGLVSLYGRGAEIAAAAAFAFHAWPRIKPTAA